MADAAEKWAAQSLYDIETAKSMLDAGRYLLSAGSREDAEGIDSKMD
jgi:hypothetical protein